MQMVRIPKVFFDDHADRDLPTPAIQRVMARHYEIDRADEAWDELLDDARYYASDVDAAYFGLVSAARGLVRAMEAA